MHIIAETLSEIEIGVTWSPGGTNQFPLLSDRNGDPDYYDPRRSPCEGIG